MQDDYVPLIPVPDELRAARLLLRPYRTDDAEAILEAVDESRADLQPWVTWSDRFRTVEDARAYCVRCAAKWLLRTDLVVGIFAGDGRYLGGANLEPSWAGRSFEVGYWLRTSAIGHGYATEAAALLVRTAFANLGANRVELRCDPNNERSRRVAERVGFVPEGRLRNAALTPAGDLRDTLVFGLTQNDPAVDAAPAQPLGDHHCHGPVVRGITRLSVPAEPQDNSRRCLRGRSSHWGPCAGTPGGIPRRSRTARPGRSRS